MIELTDYQTIEVVSNNGDIVLYRLRRSSDGLHVIAMTTYDEYPSSIKIEAFRHQYDMLQRLHGRGVPEAYNLEITPKRPILFMEDIGGTTLRQALLINGDSLGFTERLRIAAAVADCLMRIHRENITLNELTPDHLLVNLDTSEVRFIDIRMCSMDPGEGPLLVLPDRPDQVLAYISPEQTGRTKMKPDFRSDFYSFGVIVYEWLSGELPFEPQDILNIMYRHLASTPQPLHHRNLSIPESVSNIVNKCMEKMPETRYASAYGLKSDLEECLNQCLKQGELHPFVLASHDIPERWSVPSHFYGRDAEQQSLREAWNRAASGTAQVVFVGGDGGIGKTSFVKETLRKTLPPEAYVASGEFDAQHSKIPYDVWIQMIDQLVSQILTESKIQVEVWKLRMLNALDGYGRLLIELVPRLELLIGEQPAVQQVPPVEAQRRLHQLMNRMFQLFLQREHPLVLFMDDVQWTDEASLQYAAALLEHRHTNHLLLIMSYRDRDMEQQHPLFQLYKMLEEQNVRQTHIQLQAFSHENIVQLLRDAMLDSEAELDALAEVLFNKTEGNPLFLKQLFQDLINDKQVRFDDSSRAWQWNLQQIKERHVPRNTIAYLSDKLKQFPKHTIYALGRAAVLGRSFDLELLASVTGLQPPFLSDVLHIAVKEQMLQFITNEAGEHYSFVHDRIQQAAYGLLSDDERRDTHMKIGSLLVLRMKNDEAYHLFEAVNHMNAAARLERADQKLELAVLNLQAGLKAKQATAYKTALDYLSQAVALLEDNCWDRHYTLAFRIYREYAEVEYLCSNYIRANMLFDLLMEKAKTNLDKAYIYTMKIQIEVSHDNYEAVIALGRSTLQLLNIRDNYESSSAKLTLQWLKLTRRLRKYRTESILSLPTMTDETRKVAMSVLAHTTSACFFTNKNGWLALNFTMVEMTLDYGLTPEASIGFIGYAMFQYFYFNQDSESYRLGKLACDLAKPYPALYVKTLSSFSMCSNSWRQYEPNMIEMFTEHAGKVGLESGDLWLGNQSVLINCGVQLVYGYPLQRIYDQLIAQAGDLERHKHNLHWKQATVMAVLIVRLTGYRSPDDPFVEEDIYREGFAESVHGDEFRLIEDLVCSLEYLPGYLLGRYKEADEALRKSAVIAASRKSFRELSTQYIYESLVWAQLYDEASEEEQRRYRVEIKKRAKAFKKLAKRCPNNHLHKYKLIQAEFARILGKNRQAEIFYEQSMEAARKYSLIHDLAIAAECYGRHGLKQGKYQLAKIYLTEAYESYLQWGAEVKAAELERKYGHLLQIKRESALERVDSLSVVMAVQALSSEMEMNRLLDKLMRIMLHNAGASFGALIFDHEGKWMIEAIGTEEELRIEQIPLEDDSDLVPAAIIGYAARTQEEVVLHDAANEGMFVRIPYVREKGLKSVLCLPIMHQNKLMGVLYMENHLSTGIFTPQQLDMIKLLGSQCAISIANAKLYSGIQYLKDNLEEQVKERTYSLKRSMRETSAALAEASVYEERNRIAHEIHDIVGHTLTSTLLQIEAGKRLIHKDVDDATVRLREAQDLVRHSLNEIRGSIHMLKEDKYNDLSSMLNQLIQETRRNTGVAIHATLPDALELLISQKKAIYHALQEGLTNGIRHGGSTEFNFRLELTESQLQFRLRDNGSGAEVITMGFGLKAMKERVEQLGGCLLIEAESEQGCMLSIDLPYSMR